MIVDFPAPLGPTMAVDMPEGMVKLEVWSTSSPSLDPSSLSTSKAFSCLFDL